MSIGGLLPTLPGLSLAASLVGTTYHVRTDGGDASQCTGRADAPYPGSGTGQACAWQHPFFAMAPGGTKRIVGGDTVVIGSGTYKIGSGAPGAGSCSGTSCYMPPIPSGTTSARTRFVGKSASAPPKLVGNNGRMVLNLQGSSNVEVGNLEITDQNDCVYQHSNSTATCSGTNWGKTGLSASASSNVWVHDVNIHGMAHQGVLAGGLTNWTVERVKINANGQVGWTSNIGTTGSSNSGAIVLRDIEIAWNGCGERWQTGTPWACWAQQTGGYGDGLGTTYTGGQWLVEDAFIHHNTSDGLDLRYLDGAATTNVIVRRVHAVGNASNQVKVRGNSTIENSVIIGNCAYFEGKDFMIDGDNCRGIGNVVSLVMTPNAKVVVRHNTIAGEGGALIRTNEGDSTGRVTIQNNVAVGFRSYGHNDGRLAAFFYAAEAPAPVTFVSNLIWNVKNEACPAGNICGQNPKLTNMTLDAFDAEPLAGSPAIDKVAVLSGINSDFVLQPRPSGAASDIGAYEFQAGGTVPAPTPTPTPTPTCTRAAPTLTLAGPTTAVAAGTANTYNLALRNNDTSACSNTTFNLARTIPTGWTGTLSITSAALAPGASANATLKVISPTTATAGTYGIGAGVGSSVGTVHTKSASATYSVSSSASTGLTETVGTDKTSYAAKQTVYMSARVLKNGLPVSGAAVRFGALKPNGINEVVLKATTDSKGYARVSWVSDSGPSSIGTYKLSAVATYGTSKVTATSTFSVYTP